MNDNMYKTVFVLTFVSDFWANWYSYAIVHDWIILQPSWAQHFHLLIYQAFYSL